jgi:CO dehydrogenase/acetyl-CoA synthase epsilon subunit
MMKVIIEIEKDEELEIVKKAFKGKSITIVRTQKERRKFLDAIFKKYKIKLPKNYKFNREEIHAR